MAGSVGQLHPAATLRKIVPERILACDAQTGKRSLAGFPCKVGEGLTTVLTGYRL